MKAIVRKRTTRQGFTLIELIVVLLILVGLAGILIPAITDMVGRTHTSTASANFTEVSNAIQRYEAQYMSYPDGFDSLLVDMTAGTAYAELDGGLTAIGTIAAAPAGVEDTLADAGLTTFGEHAAGGEATFEPVTLAPFAAGDSLLFLNPADAVALGLDVALPPATKYVLLGVGPTNEMNGTVMVDAPVHFPENAEGNPAQVYGRFIAVFQVTDDLSAPLERAKFVGTISPHGDGLGAHIGEYFEIANNG